MKCVMCNGKLEEQLVEHKELEIPLGKFPALVCKSCGEHFFEADVVDQIQKKSKEKGLFGIAAKKTRVAQVGNSLAIRIPKEIADFLNLNKEEEVRIQPKSKHAFLVEVV